MIEEDLYYKLIDYVVEVEERVYPVVMPQNCEKPAIVYTIVSDVDEQGVNGCIAGGDVRVQIDVYAYGYLEVKELRDLVKEAIIPLGPVDIDVRDDYEDDTKLFRQIIDFKLRR